MSESSGSSDDRTEYDKISDTLLLAGLIRLDLAQAAQGIRDLVSSLDTLPEGDFVFSSSKATLEDLRHALDRYHDEDVVQASSNADIHKAALRHASSIFLDQINACEAQSDSTWYCCVSRRMIYAFLEPAVAADLASMSCYQQWKDGSWTSRLKGAYPQPTIAFAAGSAFCSLEEQRSTSLHALEIIARRFGISYSPISTHFVFPGIVCELKSDETPLFQVEAQAACNAMRALSLLEDLRIASKVSSKTNPTVVVVAASGPQWRFSLAQSRIIKGEMVTEKYPMDLVPLDIRAPAHRFRAQVIVGQIQKWLAEKHTAWVSQHLEVLWQRCQVEYEDVEGGLEPPETEDVDHWEGVVRQTGGWD